LGVSLARDLRITDVKTYPLSAPRGVDISRPDHYLPYWRELAEAGVRRNFYSLLVEVIASDGSSGWGEAIVREVPTAHREIIDRLFKPIIIGQDALAIEDLWQRMFAALKTRGHVAGYFIEALAGVDMALWDLAGKAMGLPMYRMLRGPTMSRLRAYASSIYWHYLEGFSERDFVREVERLAEAGFEQVKIKIGFEKMVKIRGFTIENILRAVRDSLGYDLEVMVDANSAYSVGEAIRVGRILERYEVTWFEEPIPPYMVEGYRELRRRLGVMIAGGESLFTKYQFQDFIRRKALDVLQPDIARVGVTEFVKIAYIAEAEGLYIAPHTGLSGPGCRAAAIYASAAIPRETFLTYEYMYKRDNPLAEEIPEKPIEVIDKGYIVVPREPGIGFKPRRASIEKYMYI
jgi:D-arabinonate dehydratase/D-galactarolactone cycloisomerase